VVLGASGLGHCQKIWTRKQEICVRKETLLNGEGNKMGERFLFLSIPCSFLGLRDPTAKKPALYTPSSWLTHFYEL
jgi:hypothetical protein